MNILKQWIFTTLIILLVLVPLSRVTSQTDEAGLIDLLTPTPEVTPEQTPEATAPVIVVTPAPAQPTGETSTLETVLAIVGLIVTGIVSGSLLTIGGVIALIKTVKHDPEKMSLIEKLHDSRPDTERTRIRTGVEIAKELVEIVDEATDGIPIRDKPQTPPKP